VVVQSCPFNNLFHWTGVHLFVVGTTVLLGFCVCHDSSKTFSERHLNPLVKQWSSRLEYQRLSRELEEETEMTPLRQRVVRDILGLDKGVELDDDVLEQRKCLVCHARNIR
jgi:hypothetical protein